jgi:hypothetical protein
MARITEKKRILVEHKADDVKNPFYVMWQNSLGGVDYWLFGIKQTKGREINNIETYTPNFSDISTAETTESQLSKDSRPFIIATAHYLTEDQVNGLLSLKESIKVMWLKDKDNNIWQEVFPEGGSYSYVNSSEGYTFQIRFNFQKRFIPSN